MIARGVHHDPHRGKPLNLIFQRANGRILVGVEGQLPIRGGWYLAVLL